MSRIVIFLFIHDNKITIHDKNITNREFFCSLGTALNGRKSPHPLLHRL